MSLKDVLTRFRFSVQDGKLRMVTTATKTAEARLRKATFQARQFSMAVNSIGARLSAFAGLGALSFVSAGVGAGLVRANVEFENLNARLIQVTGSAEKAEAATAWINNFAANTPFQIQQVSDAWINLQKRGIEPTTELMTQLGDVAAAQGKSIDQLVEGAKGVSVGRSIVYEEAIGLDVALKGNKAFVKQLDGTQVAFDKTFKGAIQYAAELGKSEKASGGMARMSQTLGGRFSNLKDSLFQLATAIGKAGLSDLLKDVTNRLIEYTKQIEKIAADGPRMKRYLEILTKGFKAVGVAIALITTGKVLQKIFALTKALQLMGTAGAIAQAKLLLIPAVLVGILLLIDDLVAFTKGEDSLFGRFLETRGIDPAPLRRSFLRLWMAIQRVGEAMVEAGKKIAEALGIDIETVDELIIAFADLFVLIVGGSAEAATALIDNFLLAGEALGKMAAASYLAIVDWWGRAVDWTATVLIPGLMDAWSWYVNWLYNIWVRGYLGMFDFLTGWLELVWGAYGWLFDRLVEGLEAYIGIWRKGFGLIWDIVVWLFNGIVSIFSTIADFYRGLFTTILGGFLSVIESAINTVSKLLNKLPDFVIDKLPSAVKDFAREGINLTGAFEEEAAAAAKKPSPALAKAEEALAGIEGARAGKPGELQTVGAVLAKEGAAPQISRSVTVGSVTVQVDGTLDMTSEEFQNAVQTGTEQALGKAIEQTMADEEEVAA